jgi:uncharacterized protein involved in exopolysaccharide biosynthesis
LHQALWILIEWLRLLREKWLLATLTFAVVASISVFFVLRKPYAYQSVSIFNLYTDYLRIPAASPYVADNFDPSDVRSEKDSILLEALNDEALLEISSQHNIENPNDPDSLIQMLRNDIVITSINRTSYQLSVTNRQKSVAKSINEKILSRIEQTLKEKRLKKLTDIRAQLQKKYDELESNSRTKTSFFVANSDERKQDIERLTNKLRLLSIRFSPQHPEIVAIKNEIAFLESGRHRPSFKPSQETVEEEARVRRETLETQRSAILARLDAIDVAIGVETDSTPQYYSIIRRPTLPSTPKGPKRMFVVAGAIVTALITALAFSSVAGLFMKWRRGEIRIEDKRNNTPAKSASQEIPKQGGSLHVDN